MQVCCHYRNTTFCICAFYSLNCVSVNPIFCFLSFVINGRLISPTHKALCDLCAKIRIFQNHTKWIFKGPLFLRVHQCDCVADKQATQLALGIEQRTDHWLDQSQCAIEVFCKVLTHTFSLRLCACARVRARGRARPTPSHTILWSLLCHARLPATPWLPQALSCDPIHFYPGHSALLPSVLPTPLGLPLLLPLLYLSFVYLLMCEIILGWRDGFLPDGLSRGVSLLFNNRFGGLRVGGWVRVCICPL